MVVIAAVDRATNAVAIPARRPDCTTARATAAVTSWASPDNKGLIWRRERDSVAATSRKP